MLAAVDAGLLFEVVWVSLLAGVGVTRPVLARGPVRRRARPRHAASGRAGAAIAYATLPWWRSWPSAAWSRYGVHIMLSKG